MVEPRGLTILKDSEFYTLVQPEDESKLEAEALAKNKLAIEDLRKAPVLEMAWKSFDSYLQKYRKGKGKSQLIPSGFNITGFDLPIYWRINKKFNISTAFNETKRLDLMDDFYRWFHNDEIKFMNLDVIRDKVGVSRDTGHNAIEDVKFCANLLIRMLGLYRRVKPRFQDCMK